MYVSNGFPKITLLKGNTPLNYISQPGVESLSLCVWIPLTYIHLLDPREILHVPATAYTSPTAKDYKSSRRDTTMSISQTGFLENSLRNNIYHCMGTMREYYAWPWYSRGIPSMCIKLTLIATQVEVKYVPALLQTNHKTHQGILSVLPCSPSFMVSGCSVGMYRYLLMHNILEYKLDSQ